MKSIKQSRLLLLIRDGLVEVKTELNSFNRIEIRWTSTGKIETFTVTHQIKV